MIFLKRLSKLSITHFGWRSLSTVNIRPYKYNRRSIYAYFLLILPTSCFALGVWQFKRRNWKANIIKNVNERIPTLPIALPSGLDIPEYSHVKVKGYFDHSKEMVIGPRTLINDFITQNGYGGKWLGGHKNRNLNTMYSLYASAPIGYCIVTPFHLVNHPGSAILINRGWVSEELRDPTTRPDGQVKGIVELSGYIRYPEKELIFPLKPHEFQCVDYLNQTPHMQYPNRRVDEMAKYSNVFPIFIDSSYESSIPGGPIGGQTRVTLPDNHTSYMIFWFVLSGFGFGIWIMAYIV